MNYKKIIWCIKSVDEFRNYMIQNIKNPVRTPHELRGIKDFETGDTRKITDVQ